MSPKVGSADMQLKNTCNVREQIQKQTTRNIVQFDKSCLPSEKSHRIQVQNTRYSNTHIQNAKKSDSPVSTQKPSKLLCDFNLYAVSKPL